MGRTDMLYAVPSFIGGLATTLDTGGLCLCITNPSLQIWRMPRPSLLIGLQWQRI